MGLVSQSLLLVFLLLGEEAAAGRFLCPTKTTLGTFNTGLVPFYPGLDPDGDPEIEERVALLIEQIQDSDVDILCLQEVFSSDLQRRIYQELKQKYPYIQSVIDLTEEANDTAMACTIASLQQLQICTAQTCDGLTGIQLLACSAVGCLPLISDPVCRDCIINYSPSSFGATACLQVPASTFQTNYGLMLLSRRELTNTRASGFNPQSRFRGYLEASVDGVGDLLCTHLTALLSTEVYFGPPSVSPPLYSTYDEQQYDEILTIFDLVNSKDTPILMGDFNSGPASVGDVRWELPFHYGLMNARGFISPYVLRDGRCTFCADNPTVAISDFPQSNVLDHIYLTTNSYKGRVISSERFLDNTVTATGTTLSDHYGVKVTLRNIRSDCRWWERVRYYCPIPDLRLFEAPSPQSDLDRLCVASTA